MILELTTAATSVCPSRMTKSMPMMNTLPQQTHLIHFVECTNSQFQIRAQFVVRLQLPGELQTKPIDTRPLVSTVCNLLQPGNIHLTQDGRRWMHDTPRDDVLPEDGLYRPTNATFVDATDTEIQRVGQWW